jgi:hypothetical protein
MVGREWLVVRGVADGLLMVMVMAMPVTTHLDTIIVMGRRRAKASSEPEAPMRTRRCRSPRVRSEE